MARPGVLNSLYDHLQHWRYNDPIKDAELMSLRFVKPINLNRQMVQSKSNPKILTGFHGRVRSGYAFGWVAYPWVDMIYGDKRWSASAESITFTDGSLRVRVGDTYVLQMSKTSPELSYQNGSSYYTVSFPFRTAKIRCPILDNPLAYLLEAGRQY